MTSSPINLSIKIALHKLMWLSRDIKNIRVEKKKKALVSQINYYIDI